jgi:hypothetical protein
LLLRRNGEAKNLALPVSVGQGHSSTTANEIEMSRCLERAKGIEPSYAAWEAAVLPLNYARSFNALHLAEKTQTLLRHRNRKLECLPAEGKARTGSPGQEAPIRSQNQPVISDIKLFEADAQPILFPPDDRTMMFGCLHFDHKPEPVRDRNAACGLNQGTRCRDV